MYFDIDDILADSQKFSGSFAIDVEDLGFLTTSNSAISVSNTGAKKISKKEKVEIPFWLLTQLTQIFINESENETLFNVERPEYFGNLAINFYKASPLNSNLSTLPYFYKLVEKWCYLIDDLQLVDTIFELLIKRVGKINDLSFNSLDIQSRENLEFLQSFDIFEKELFKNSSESYQDTRQWLKRVKK